MTALFRMALFLLTPLREGRRAVWFMSKKTFEFLLTPLREGRLKQSNSERSNYL